MRADALADFRWNSGLGRWASFGLSDAGERQAAERGKPADGKARPAQEATTIKTVG
jgi:hypothetical protein